MTDAQRASQVGQQMAQETFPEGYLEELRRGFSPPAMAQETFPEGYLEQLREGFQPSAQAANPMLDEAFGKPSVQMLAREGMRALRDNRLDEARRYGEQLKAEYPNDSYAQGVAFSLTNQ